MLDLDPEGPSRSWRGRRRRRGRSKAPARPWRGLLSRACGGEPRSNDVRRQARRRSQARNGGGVEQEVGVDAREVTSFRSRERPRCVDRRGACRPRREVDSDPGDVPSGPCGGWARVSTTYPAVLDVIDDVLLTSCGPLAPGLRRDRDPDPVGSPSSRSSPRCARSSSDPTHRRQKLSRRRSALRDRRLARDLLVDEDPAGGRTPHAAPRSRAGRSRRRRSIRSRGPRRPAACWAPTSPGPRESDGSRKRWYTTMSKGPADLGGQAVVEVGADGGDPHAPGGGELTGQPQRLGRDVDGGRREPRARPATPRRCRARRRGRARPPRTVGSSCAALSLRARGPGPPARRAPTADRAPRDRRSRTAGPSAPGSCALTASATQAISAGARGSARSGRPGR